MIALNHQSRILLATQAMDFRKGIDGFVAACKQVLGQDPRSGICFVFINRRATMIRALVYDGTGFWLMTKRLSKSHFLGWPTGASAVDAVDAKYLRVLLSGANPTRLQPVKFTTDLNVT